MTPLTELAQQSAGVVGRRAAVVATAGGLIISTFGGATAAQAAPAPQDATRLSTVDLGKLTEQAREALSAAPAVTVDADAQVQVEAVTAEGIAAVEVTPAPRPEPVVRAASAPSRSAERAAAPGAQATSASVGEVSAAPSFASGSAVVSIASRYVGVPYVSGGSTPDGFDCSGFTSYVYAQVGINLPRSSGAQRSAGTVVSAADAQPGDLIWTPGHVSIYAGNGMQIDAPRPGKTIQFRGIWQSNPTFIRVG
nr:C40 family peptidase [Xylanimonas oleitrophica]